MSLFREICCACNHSSPVGFSVTDEIWEASVPVRFRDAVLCIGCFTRFADEAGVQWDRDIKFYPISLVTHLGGGELVVGREESQDV